MKLNEVLGDDYALVEEQLRGTSFIEDDGKLIPKYRFDELNGRMKFTEKEVKKLNFLLEERQAEIEDLCSQICEIKNGYQKALSILRVKEIFVSGGLTQSDYQDLVDIIVKTGEEDMIALANHIIKLLQHVKNKPNNTNLKDFDV